MNKLTVNIFDFLPIPIKLYGIHFDCMPSAIVTVDKYGYVQIEDLQVGPIYVVANEVDGLGTGALIELDPKFERINPRIYADLIEKIEEQAIKVVIRDKPIPNRHTRP